MPKTPLALAALNLLNERPMHPYEMRSLMRERGYERVFRLKEASLYDTVERLAGRGFIEPVEVNREGRRPERTIYAITESGRDELLVWLTELTSEPSPEYPTLAAALTFIYALGREGAIAALSQRARALEAEIAKMDAYRRAFVSDNPDVPRLFGIEDEYAQAMRRAELDWVRRTMAELRDGSLRWPVVPGEEEGSDST
jgi:DNA-binding PadR family transcriptional regulator